MKYYIGLDAPSTTSTFAVVDENGQCILRETAKTSEQTLVHVINKIQGVRHMTFEESSISQWLYLQLKDKVDHLLICNPTYVAKKQGAKTDFRDAQAVGLWKKTWNGFKASKSTCATRILLS